jgi:hypothetical protein
MRCLAVLLPVLLLWGASGDPLWLRAAIVTVATLIGVERAHMAPLGVLLQASAIMAGFLGLLWALKSPPLFVLGSALLASVAIGLSTFDRKLRSLGNFIFIPTLYLACETAEGAQPDQYWAQGLHFLPYLALSMLPVWALSLVEHRQRRDAMGPWRHYASLRFAQEADAPMPAKEAMLVGGLAVACAATLVEWLRLGHGQWVIWSAASVVTGDVLSAKRKLRDRVMGALAGVPPGIVLGQMLPHVPMVYALLALATAVTLVAFRRYPVGFAARCACAAAALTVLNAPALEASERLINVLLGGAIGVSLLLAIHDVSRRLEKVAGMV